MRGVFYFYTMHYFIKEVVKRLSRSKIPFSKYTFVLPNKRSALFLKKEISRFHNADIISPKIFEIDEFMQHISGLKKWKNLSYTLTFTNAISKIILKKMKSSHLMNSFLGLN